MEFMGTFSGSSPVIKKYKASAAQAVGTIVLQSAGGDPGQMTTCSTTGFANSLGLCIDNGLYEGASIAYSTTQGQPEAVWGVIVNPDMILRALMVTGATGTSITSDTIATATANGTTTVGGTSVASPSMDEGLVWYLSGANVGKSRKIVSVSSVTATVTVPFAANAVGDTFCYCGLNVGMIGVTTTTDLKNIRTDIASATGGAATVLDVELAGVGDSYVHLVLADNVFNMNT